MLNNMLAFTESSCGKGSDRSSPKLKDSIAPSMLAMTKPSAFEPHV
jgi:hypothetical protein